MDAYSELTSEQLEQITRQHIKSGHLKICPVCGSKQLKEHYEAHREECFDT